MVYRGPLAYLGLFGGRLFTARIVAKYTLELMNMGTDNIGTVDERTVVVVVAGSEYRCTPEQAAYVNDDSAPCHVVIRSPEHIGGGSLPPVYKGTGAKRDRERIKVEKKLMKARPQQRLGERND